MGQCLGINIARVDRVTTYAIPFSEINPLRKMANRYSINQLSNGKANYNPHANFRSPV